MAFDPDDKRPLFERVVDDLRNDIKYGRLKTEERVPPAASWPSATASPT